MAQDVQPIPAAPPRPPGATRSAAHRLGPVTAAPRDPNLQTLWGFHPTAVFEGNRNGRGRGPFFQFRVPYGFEWNRLRLPVPNLPKSLEGLRILHVTDFHLHRFWKAPYDELLAGIARHEPDLLLSGGDYVEDKSDFRPAWPMVRRLVDGFRGRLGAYGILGNHDRHWMEAPLRRTRMTLIDGRRVEIPFGDDWATIDIVGLPGVHRDELKDEFLDSIPPRREQSLRIVLSHFPDHLRRTQYVLQPDLFLAGHTHGGQCCLPGGYPIIRHDTMPRRLCSGAHWIERTWLVVNRGFGFSGMPVRVFCPAEVLELTLTRMT